MIQPCPFCLKLHDSDEYDVDWYFVCCGHGLLVWREVDGTLLLEVVPDEGEETETEPEQLAILSTDGPLRFLKD